jgi:hypothetical protein
MRFAFFFLSVCTFAQETMLCQAERIAQLYSQEIAKTPPASNKPRTDEALTLASVWLSIAPNHFSMECLATEEPWKFFKEMGIEALHIVNIRNDTELGFDSRWGWIWPQIVNSAQFQGMHLAGDLIGASTLAGPDFQAALQNIGDYPNLYHLVEINPEDWSILPEVPVGNQEANIPWLTVQELNKKGYLFEKINPYVKTSDWNATSLIKGIDGVTRRFAYLKEGNNHPLLNWTSPSFAAYRILAGDVLTQWKQNREQILKIDGQIPKIAIEQAALLIRKVGAYSVSTTSGTIQSMKEVSTDLLTDEATKPALLHALMTEDASALRLIYQTLLNNQIEMKRLVHTLPSLEDCDWIEWIHQKPMMKELKARLLKEDVLRLGKWDRLKRSQCDQTVILNDFEKNREEIIDAQSLFAFLYAMQPGALSLSYADLLGTLSDGIPLYADIPCQLTHRQSFASRLKNILQIRSTSNIKTGELIQVICSPNQGTLLLLHRLPKNNMLQLLAINFSKQEAFESLDLKELRCTTAIDLMSKLAADKNFSSSQFSFTLPPISGKAFIFQPKTYTKCTK